MTRSPSHIMETVEAAQPIIERLHDRIAASRSFHDIGDLSAIQTPIREIEKLLGAAVEYEEILRQQLARTSARIAAPSPWPSEDCMCTELPHSGSLPLSLTDMDDVLVTQHSVAARPVLAGGGLSNELSCRKVRRR